jgi:hypothetical protein
MRGDGGFVEQSEFSADRVLMLGTKSHTVMLLRSILGAPCPGCNQAFESV